MFSSTGPNDPAPPRPVPLAVVALAAASAAWGVLPVYWKALKHVDALEVMTHRVVWSFLVGVLIIRFRGEWGAFRVALAGKGVWRSFCLSGALLGANWFTFIWAVSHDRVVETSLGYFICPLVNVLLGRVVLREYLRPWQVVAVLLAVGGVVNMVVWVGSLPIVAVVLAVTFALYALMRKTAPLESLPGLVVETGLLSIPGWAALCLWAARGTGAVGLADPATRALLIGAGVVTALPLLCFAYGARRLRLSTVGLMHYLTPTGMFILGVFVYREPFSVAHLITFACVWAALAVYSTEGILAQRRLVLINRVMEGRTDYAATNDDLEARSRYDDDSYIGMD